MQENLKHKCSRPYETKTIWSSARHHMETALPRLGSKIMLHIRLMIFRHLNDSEEIRKRAGLRPAFYDKNGETEKHQRILPSPSWWPRRNPLPFVEGPHHAMSSSYATSGILCCLSMGEMSNPWPAKMEARFFDFVCASLNFTSRPSWSQWTRPPVPLHLRPFVLLAAAVPASGRNTAHGQCLKMFRGRSKPTI